MSGTSVLAIDAGLKHQTRRPVNLAGLRISLPARVEQDIPHMLMSMVDDTPPISFAPGRYHARLNPQGAVIARKGRDKVVELGIKPGEFHFICPYGDGITKLEPRSGCDRKVWTIHPYADQRLWVREEWGVVSEHEGRELEDAKSGMPWAGVVYRTQSVYLHDQPLRWRRPMFMPRWACRRVLRPIVIRLERLQDMTEEDAVAEGVTPYESQDGLENTAREMYAALWDRMWGKGEKSWAHNPWVWSTTFERLPVAST